MIPCPDQSPLIYAYRDFVSYGTEGSASESDQELNIWCHEVSKSYLSYYSFKWLKDQLGHPYVYHNIATGLQFNLTGMEIFEACISVYRRKMIRVGHPQIYQILHCVTVSDYMFRLTGDIKRLRVVIYAGCPGSTMMRKKPQTPKVGTLLCLKQKLIVASATNQKHIYLFYPKTAKSGSSLQTLSTSSQHNCGLTPLGLLHHRFKPLP